MPIPWNAVIFEFRSIFAPESEYLCREWPFIVMFREIMLNRVSFVLTDQWAFHTTLWKAIPDIMLIGRKCRAKFENDRISRNGLESKLPNQIEWFRYHIYFIQCVKILTTFCRNVLKIHRSVFYYSCSEYFCQHLRESFVEYSSFISVSISLYLLFSFLFFLKQYSTTVLSCINFLYILEKPRGRYF